jgi:hypothetical protein
MMAICHHGYLMSKLERKEDLSKERLSRATADNHHVSAERDQLSTINSQPA